MDYGIDDWNPNYTPPTLAMRIEKVRTLEELNMLDQELANTGGFEGYNLSQTITEKYVMFYKPKVREYILQNHINSSSVTKKIEQDIMEFLIKMFGYCNPVIVTKLINQIFAELSNLEQMFKQYLKKSTDNFENLKPTQLKALTNAETLRVHILWELGDQFDEKYIDYFFQRYVNSVLLDVKKALNTKD